MKMITRRALFLTIFCIGFIGGICFLLFSFFNDGDSWVMKHYNSHLYSNGQLLGIGDIVDKNDNILAKSTNDKREYNDSELIRKSTLHIVGDSNGFISNGVQNSYLAELTGYNALTGIYDNINKADDEDKKTMKLTIDSNACKVAYQQLSNYDAGCVGVVNYKTGEIVCSVSTPSFDPENIPEDIDTNPKYSGAYINRLTSGLYTPGSTFKIVVAICAVENIPDIYDRTFKCTGEYDPGEGKPIECNATHGKISFKQAFAKSCNSVFSQLAIELGEEKLEETVNSLGLTQPAIVSGKTIGEIGRYYLSSDESNADDYIGWTGIGQGDTLIAPFAMLRLCSAIANEGKLVNFSIIESLTGSSFNIKSNLTEVEIINSQTAQEVKKLMRNNVKKQYGDYRFRGLDVCAKSGTAQIDEVDSHNTAWFTGFVDSEKYPYAFVVVVEKGGSGSNTGAPIASKVLQAIVNSDE